MDSLSVQDYINLITFYKNKSADLELQYLLLQINSKKESQILLENQKKELDANYGKELSIAHTRVAQLDQTILKLNKNSTKNNKIETKNNKKEK
jgi:hypothetical protein